jgi:hypothetical protein
MSKTTRIIASIILPVFCAGPVRAQSFGDEFTPSQPPSVVGEAAKAVVDRVFGVEGEAADIKYHAVELSNHSPLNAGIRSALLPGWGQWFNRQPVKAAAFFTVITLGAYGALHSYHRSNRDYDEYEAIGNRNDTSYDDYTRHRTQALILGGTAAFLYVYSIFDAYRNAYNPLWSQEPSVQLALNAGGATVEWRRRF